MRLDSCKLLGMDYGTKRNFQWPDEIDEVFEALLGGRRLHKKIVSAAILMFAESSEHTQAHYLGRVADADANDRYRELTEPILTQLRNRIKRGTAIEPVADDRRMRDAAKDIGKDKGKSKKSRD
jgi:L-rhamnose isomerase